MGISHIPPNQREAVFFCLLLSTLILLFGGYSYGTRDQVEQLPMVFRRLDPSYCTNDFFTNASTEFGPRFYYAWFLGLLGAFFSLPIIFLTLTWLSNFGIALVTYSAARKLTNGSDLAAMIACTLVMGTPAITLGGVLPLAQMQLTPFALACPFALVSLWAGLRGRIFLCVVPMILICPIHPQVSLEIGIIALTTSGLSTLIFRIEKRRAGPSSTPIPWAKQLKLILVGYLILGVSVAAFWLPWRNVQTLEISEFIRILAYFRHPHHFIPSTWRLSQYLLAAGFLLVFGLSWVSWRRRFSCDKSLAFRIMICVLIVFLLWCGGYVFVELLPSRWWTTAQTFRLSFAVNWMGFLVIARAIAEALETGSKRYHLFRSVTSYDNMSEPRLFGAVRAIVKPGRAMLEAVLLLVFLASGILLVGNGTLWDSGFFLILPAITVWLLFYLTLRHRTGAAFVLVLLWLIIAAVSRHPAIPDVKSVVGKLSPAITLADTKEATFDVASYARRETPEDAVFLTPPNFGRFRLTARRSIVVDFKAFPFQDWAIWEWKQRLENCYGSVNSTGFSAMEAMEKNYRQIDTAGILDLQQRYGISYALLYSQTESHFPILYAGDEYKLVVLPCQR